MSKRIQVVLSQKALDELDKVLTAASTDFNTGTITLSDVVSEMVLSSNIDIKDLRIKHTNIRKYLKNLAQDENTDLDSALKTLLELKSQLSKKQLKLSKINDGVES